MRKTMQSGRTPQTARRWGRLLAISVALGLASQAIGQTPLWEMPATMPGSAAAAPSEPSTAPPRNEPRVESYVLDESSRDVLLAWQRQTVGRQDIRVAIDERTSQALVFAPPAAHEQLRRQLAQAQQAAAPTAPAAATQAARATGPLQLRTLQPAELHRRLERLVGRPLPLSADASGEWVGFPVEVAAGTSVTLSISNRTGEVRIDGPPEQAAAWRTVVEAMDSPPGEAGTVTQLVATQPANQHRVRQALQVLQTQRAGGTRAVRTALMQPAAETDEPADDQPADAEAADEPITEIVPAPDRLQTAQDAIDRAQAAGSLMGPVQIEFVEGLDVIVIRGAEQDVQRVMEIIRRIEEESQISAPAIEVKELQHVSSEAMAALLTRLYTLVLGPRIGDVSITPLVRPNALLLIGRTDNVRMAIELIDQLDQPVPPTSRFEVFPLRHASATEAKALVDEYLARDVAQAAATGTDAIATLASRALVVADVRTNSLVVSGGPRDILEIGSLVQGIDRPAGIAVDRVRVFPLRNAIASELATVLQNAIQAQGATEPAAGTRPSALEFLTIDAQQVLQSGVLSGVRITAEPRGNSLVVAAPAESMDLIAALIAQLDQTANVSAELKVFTIQNGDATSLVTMLRTLFGAAEGQQAAAQLGGVGQGGLVRLQFSVDQRTNSIIVAGSRDDLAVVEAILLRLDEGDIRDRITVVYRLKNAFANDVSLALNQWLQSEQAVQADAQLVVSPFQQIEREVIIVPEPVTNSLIVSATPRFFEDIRRLIEDLDERPPMVMIQVLIAEVRLNDTDEFGIELGLQDSLLFDRSLLGELQTITTTTQQTGAGGAVTSITEQQIVNAPLQPGFNFNNQPLGNNGSTAALANAGNVAAQGLSNFALNRINQDLGFGGFVFSASSNSVSVLLRALQENRRLEVLSRPQITTLDGQLGQVQVGQAVPTITGQTITQFGQQNNILYREVGLILQVLPRISPDGMVVMQIFANKSEVGSQAEGIPIDIAANGQVLLAPRIDQTQAITTVSAMDGQTIVLSGLLQTRKFDVHRRVPILADIPLLGDLFRYDSVAEERRELLIILTPQIIYNKQDAELLKRVESSRMSWILSDVMTLHGPAGLRSRCDEWYDGEMESVYPHYIPRDGELMPPGEGGLVPQGPLPGLPMPFGEGGLVPQGPVLPAAPLPLMEAPCEVAPQPMYQQPMEPQPIEPPPPPPLSDRYSSEPKVTQTRYGSEDQPNVGRYATAASPPARLPPASGGP